MLPTTALNGISLVLLFAFPAFSLFHQSAPGAVLHVFASMGLIRLVYLAADAERRTVLKTFWERYGLLSVALAAPLVINAISTVSAGSLDNAYPSTLQRLAMGGLVLLAVSRLPFRLTHVFQWGIIVAALASGVVLYTASNAGAIRPAVEAQNLLNYTNFIVLLCVYCLYMLNWRLSSYAIAEAVIKVLAAASAFYAVWLSESRGPTLSLAALLLLLGLYGFRRLAFRWRIAGGAAMLAIVLASALQSDRLVLRMEEAAETAITTLPAILSGKQPTGGDGSTRVRFELWHASWLMLKERPWFGDGSQSFSERLIALNRSGQVSDEATWTAGGKTAFTQPHNELANAVATRGIAGGIVLLMLYGVPLWYFVRRRRTQDTIVRGAADMGVVTCVGTILFGLTVSVFTSGWMCALYVTLNAIFLVLSQRCPSGGAVSPRRDDANQNVPDGIPGPASRKFFKELYLLGHGRHNRHNSHLWPYVRVSRNAAEAIECITVFKRNVPLIPISEAFASADKDFHIILSGGSISEIDYAKLPRLQAMGVNGSIALKERFDIDFPYYCVIDRSFARSQRHMMKRIVSEVGIFLLTPDVLRYMLEYIPLESIRCRLCIIEDVRERAYKPRPTAASLNAMKRQGMDIIVFDDDILLGFSFNPNIGAFDADTVAYTALQAVVWGGARRVYLHGLDIKGAESTPRFYEGTSAETRPSTRLEQNFELYIEPSFRQSVSLLQTRGIQVYNLSPISALGPGVIPFMDWRGLRAIR